MASAMEPLTSQQCQLPIGHADLADSKWRKYILINNRNTALTISSTLFTHVASNIHEYTSNQTPWGLWLFISNESIDHTTGQLPWAQPTPQLLPLTFRSGNLLQTNFSKVTEPLFEPQNLLSIMHSIHEC